MFDKLLEKCINEEDFYSLIREYVYRGVSKKEANETIKAGHLLSSRQDRLDSLMANDFEVLEQSTPEEILTSEDESAFEEYWNEKIPAWAHKEGTNVTTDFENASGYGERVLVLDIGDTEIFQPSEVYIQVREPEKVDLVAVLDAKVNRIVWQKEEA